MSTVSVVMLQLPTFVSVIAFRFGVFLVFCGRSNAPLELTQRIPALSGEPPRVAIRDPGITLNVGTPSKGARGWTIWA
jgi:hypothetical protein